MLGEIINAGYLEEMPKDPYGGDNKYDVKFEPEGTGDEPEGTGDEPEGTGDSTFYKVVVVYGDDEILPPKLRRN